MNTKRFIIIGGGFAGVKLAQKLEKTLPNNWDIFLLSKTNFITYNPLLPEVIGASVLPGHVQAPIRLMLKRTRIRMVEVERIDYTKKCVHYHQEGAFELGYDQLVLASGVKANLDMLEGQSEHSLPLKTVGDALAIRNRAIERLEQATIHPDENRRKALTRFAILGGGFSGVEAAGELEDFLRSAQKYYKNVKAEDCIVYCIHSGDRLLPELPTKLSLATQKNFEKRGIRVMLNQRAHKIEHERITLQSGESIDAATIISTVGTAAHAFIANESLEIQRGKVVTQQDMRVFNAQGQWDGVWALGDCALVPNAESGQFSPPTAQFADRQAKVLAKNVVLQIQGKTLKPFSYKPIGTLASIGHNKAVAELFGMRFKGLIGFMMWRGVYLLKIPTFSRKIRLFLEWTWAMIFPPDIAHLGFHRSEKKPKK